MKKIKKILIANRGEIACRVIHTAIPLGIKTVALYSSADVNSRHVRLADEAYDLGAAPAVESYLNQDKIIAACKKHGVDAVHPGYGFLSENTEFSKRLEEENIIFIGPKAHSIDAMGDKSKAKALMEKAKVPLVPGYHGEAQDEKTLLAAAKKIGFPVLLKASAGGGGKGMKIAEDEKSFSDALASAKREALNAFGNDHMLIEKYLANPRHIEVQIFADQQGNVVHLFERDCSLQRRHQKVIEEAPAHGMNETLRKKLGQAAINAAKAVDYVGAGTVEFLLDEDDSFYFMEMNTRLQVEHPVTEEITSQDLVAWQIMIAEGAPLPVSQKDLTITGHALEVRLYAEDPNDNFLPQAGSITHFVTPYDARVETSLDDVLSWEQAKAEQVSIFYDPMIAKFITHGETREDAIQHMIRSLEETEICGIKTNRDFLLTCLNHASFQAGKISTKFIDQNLDTLLEQTPPKVPLERQRKLAACALYARLDHGQSESPWGELDAWQLNMPATLSFTIEEQPIDVLSLDFSITHMGDHIYHLHLGETSYVFRAVFEKHAITLLHEGETYHLSYDNPQSLTNSHKASKDSDFSAPMPAKITKVFVTQGQQVKMGDKLLILEAMKMEHTIKAPANGTVQKIELQEGQQVDEGFILLDFEEETA